MNNFWWCMKSFKNFESVISIVLKNYVWADALPSVAGLCLHLCPMGNSQDILRRVTPEPTIPQCRLHHLPEVYDD